MKKIFTVLILLSVLTSCAFYGETKASSYSIDFLSAFQKYWKENPEVVEAGYALGLLLGVTDTTLISFSSSAPLVSALGKTQYTGDVVVHFYSGSVNGKTVEMYALGADLVIANDTLKTSIGKADEMQMKFTAMAGAVGFIVNGYSVVTNNSTDLMFPQTFTANVAGLYLTLPRTTAE